MPEEEQDDRLVKFCVYCGSKVDADEVYCPNCGKLVIKEPSKLKDSIGHQKTTPKPREIPARKCANCGSLIRSPILKQCPVCGNELEEAPPIEMLDDSRTSGFIFTEDRLEPEEERIISRTKWNIREGTSVFTTSILVYITTMLMLTLFFLPEQNIFGIILSQLPEIFIGIYPLWYISTNNHSLEKLGLKSSKRSVLIAGVVGIIGGVGLIFFEYLSELLIELMLNLGLRDLFDLSSLMTTSFLIQNADLIWFIILAIMVSLSAISSEILFRGTLHNALKERFGTSLKNKAVVILIIALTYSGLYAILAFPVGVVLLPSYFLLSVILGTLYEVGNRNLMCSIIASVIYNLSILMIIWLIL
ncbi:MAG: putative CAAX amino terminal protease self-immunity [Promethearchaeota archaeon]|nr:MAG: putative CAAX amino terminal protease self-immunity [Candidatus Lokiarchaeota archaeon]